MLANLLLITPVFYALLMFRASKARHATAATTSYFYSSVAKTTVGPSGQWLSKAIFGSLSKRVTVDLIMHYETWTNTAREFETMNLKQ